MNLPFQATDEQMMWQVQTAGDAGAFAELVRRWEQPIQRLCVRMVGDVHRAEDLSQEAFSRVFARRQDFEPTGKFSTWLWRIAVNLCHDELRRRTRRGEVALSVDDGAPDPDPAISREPAAPDQRPDEKLESLERAEIMRRALLALPEHYRSVVVLRHYEGLRFAEIGAVLGIPEGTVKSRMAEALLQLGSRIRPGTL